MTTLEEIAARIDAGITSLAGRVAGALDLSEMLRRKALPNYTPAAFVLPNGLVARGDGDAAANAFLQSIDELYSVVLVLRTAADVTGARTQPKLDALILEVIAAVCGWGPDEAVGVMALRRGRLVSLDAGTVFYQLDFALQNQIRVLS